jgi:hypothetical protein
MPIGQLIGQQHLVDEAVEIAEIAIAAVQNHAHAHVHAVNAETLLTYALAQRRADAHFVKIVYYR